MTPRQKIAMTVLCVLIFICILELVRRRKLKEEYSWLWLLTSVSLFLLIVKYDWLVAITAGIGAALPTTTLFIGALIFLLILSVQFSVRISTLSTQFKNLAQETALLREQIESLNSGSEGDSEEQAFSQQD